VIFNRDGRRKSFFLLLAALLSSLFISVSLSGLQLRAGLPFPGPSGEDVSEYQTGFYEVEPLLGTASTDFLRVIPLLLIFIFFYLMLRYDGVKQVVFGVSALCMFLWLLAIVLNWLMPIVFGDRKTIGGLSDPPQEIPMNTFQMEPIGNAPTIFIWLVIIGLAFLVVSFGFWLHRTTSKNTSTTDLIRAEAKNALKEIQEGEELSNIVIRCYLQMVYVLETERGIEREDSMTTQEFKRLLISHGFPERAVHRLTTLFEKVRYGNKLIDTNDEITAVDCLTAITGSMSDRGDREC
jgi:hypothetical protein